MRDSADSLSQGNMENFDPVGFIQILSYLLLCKPCRTMKLPDASLSIIRALKIEGGVIQLAPDPHSFALCYRSKPVYLFVSLASKVTGYPIAKLAAKIKVAWPWWGHQPSYRFNLCHAWAALTTSLWKFHVSRHLTSLERWASSGTQMKATGEVMAIGRNITKPVVPLLKLGSLQWNAWTGKLLSMMPWLVLLSRPQDDRLSRIRSYSRRGYTPEELLTDPKIDIFILINFCTSGNWARIGCPSKI